MRWDGCYISLLAFLNTLPSAFLKGKEANKAGNRISCWLCLQCRSLMWTVPGKVERKGIPHGKGPRSQGIQRPAHSPAPTHISTHQSPFPTTLHPFLWHLGQAVQEPTHPCSENVLLTWGGTSRVQTPTQRSWDFLVWVAHVPGCALLGLRGPVWEAGCASRLGQAGSVGQAGSGWSRSQQESPLHPGHWEPDWLGCG